MFNELTDRRALRLTDPVVETTLTNMARKMGVPKGQVSTVVAVTQDLARMALWNALDHADHFLVQVPGEDAHEDDGIGEPPKGELEFTCWVLEIGARRAARVARLAWIERYRIDSGECLDLYKDASEVGGLPGSPARSASSSLRETYGRWKRRRQAHRDPSPGDLTAPTGFFSRVRWSLRNERSRWYARGAGLVLAMVVWAVTTQMR